MSDNLYTSFFAWAKNQKTLNLSPPLAVAVSGGPDSMALAAMMADWVAESDGEIHFLTVDHGLRASSKQEAQMVSNWVRSLNNKNLHHKILIWQDDKPTSAVMEAARHARYDLMAAYCAAHKIQNLFVAHHQDDQAETFLIRLSKGSGLDGLGGMQEVRDYNDQVKIIRPLLNASKDDLISYCEAHDVPYAQDPSNENTDYMRPRLRQSMDVLAEEGLSAKRLSLTAKRLRRARQALSEISQGAYQACLIDKTDQAQKFNFAKLQGCPEEIALRVLQSAVEELRPDAEYQVRMEKLEDLFDALWLAPQNFKPRTLGGCKFFLKSDKDSNILALWIEKEGF